MRAGPAATYRPLRVERRGGAALAPALPGGCHRGGKRMGERAYVAQGGSQDAATQSGPQLGQSPDILSEQKSTLDIGCGRGHCQVGKADAGEVAQRVTASECLRWK